MFEKRLEIGYLLDFYGGLLNERRRTVLDLYYNDDLSLAEIATSLGITRQGARDLIKKTGDELLWYEEKLRVAEKFRIIDACAEQADTIVTAESDCINGDTKNELAVLISNIRHAIKE